MALLSEDKRIEIFKALNLGEYNKANIKALQSKYLARKSDADGIYGQNTDNLLRHLYNCHKYLNKDNFKPQEFKCECNGRYCCGYPTYMKPAQLTNLQTIRNKYKKPMTITSGMRCKGYNNSIGGSISNSKHLLGQATDFYMQGVTDTLANRKNFIKYAVELPNTTYIYGNGCNGYMDSGKWRYGSVSAPYMGNAIHYDTKDGNPTTNSTSEVKGENKLVVDGIGGTDTVKRMQEFFGTTQDGVISGQNITLQKKYYPSLIAVKGGTGGSPCIKNLQRWVGATQDGILGQATVKAWQKKLGVTVDGIFGTGSMKAWQKYLNENKKPVYPPTPIPTPTPTKEGKILDACKVQAEWMKNFTYEWERNPTIPKSKYKGTCVTYVSCVLQRLGVLKSGQALWHNGRGYGDGKVTGANDKMTVTYMNNKTFTLCQKVLKPGDVVLCDDNKSGEKGNGGHIMIFSGQWTNTGNPYVYDQNSATYAKKGKSLLRNYPKSHKILAIVRVKDGVIK